MNKRLRLSMALALALGCSQAYALGLGQIQVKSALNQPLVAEIPVLTSSPGEADALRVRLAAPEAFARIGLDEPSLQASNLAFEVTDDGHGRTIIRITTPGKVTDPFLSFLLEVDWGKGKMLREYTVLLDPPTMMPITRSAPATVAPLTEPEPARAEPLLEVPPPMPEPAPEPAPVFEPAVTAEASPSAEALDRMSVASPPPASAPAAVAATYGPVATGDTLWSIAQSTRPDDSVSVNQMMLALLHANPEAFIDNNINRLRKGAVLRIPGRDEATVLAAADAAAQVREQMQSWSGQVASYLQPATATGGAPASSRAGAGASADSRLELTPPRGSSTATASTSGAAADGEGRELRAELARSQEEISALNQENVELKSRVSELEDLQSESRRLLDLKDSELAAAQRRLKEAGEAAEAAQAAVLAGVENTLDDVISDAGAPALAAADADAELAPGTDGNEALDDDTHVTLAEDQPDAPFDAPDGYDQVDDATMGAGEAVAEVAASESEPLPAEPVTDDAASSAGGFNPWLVGGGGALLLGLVGLLLMRRKRQPAMPAHATDGAAGTTPAVAMPEAGDIEGELIEAISQHPDDLYLHLDLLRHYYTGNDALGFEMAAEAMHAQVRDGGDPAWEEACSMGREIAPEHPLFNELSGDAATGTIASATGGASAFADEAADESDDFGYDIAAGDADSEPDAEDWSAAPHAEPEQVATGETDEFGFEPAAEGEIEEEFADSDVDADVVSTKLELARAYLDMGDNEGARGMLEEVLSEGNDAQRDEARELLDGMS